MKKKENSQNSS